MRTRTFITGLVSLPINAVLFGLGAITVLSIPALSVHAVYLLPAIIVASMGDYTQIGSASLSHSSPSPHHKR